MCGRSSLSKTEKALELRFNACFYSDTLIKYNPLPNYNVAPTQLHPVITNAEPDRLQYYKWGLIPTWAKDSKIAYKMINARKETLTEKVSFKKLLESQRCLIPFDGFYEWKKVNNTKVPYRIVTKDQDIFCTAGLWQIWNDEVGNRVYSFTVITLEPNELMSRIHHRMPAILLPTDERIWLQEDLSTIDLLELLQPYPSDQMHAYRVSDKIGNVKNNNPDLVREVFIPNPRVQGSLF